MYDDIKLILDKEQYRQDTTIELIASENYASQAVMDLCGSILTNKYVQGNLAKDTIMVMSIWMILKIRPTKSY